MCTTEMKPIIFYDIASSTQGRSWSPNTMKTRYCLGYKELPFTTVWVELPDIAALLQSKGITKPPYTLPAIEDPNTGKFIMDSLAIATYLDDTYPEAPKVLSPAVHAALEGVWDLLSPSSRAGAGRKDFGPRLVFLILAADRLNPVSNTYCHQTRTAIFGERWTTLREACSASPERRAEEVEKGIEGIKGAWRDVTALYSRGEGPQSDGVTRKEGGPFVLGEEPCFLDFAVAGRIKFIMDGLIPSEMETVTNLEGGTLMRLVESLERYYRY